MTFAPGTNANEGPPAYAPITITIIIIVLFTRLSIEKSVYIYHY